MINKDHMIDLVDGRFNKTTAQDLSSMFKTIEQDPLGGNLVIHFHGGLVSRKSAVDSANTVLVDAYRAGGAYPIFFIWNSDLITMLTANLDEIGQEKVFKRLVRRVAQFALGKLKEKLGGGARGGTVKEWSLKKVPEDLSSLEKVLYDEEKLRGGFAYPELHEVQKEQFAQLLEDDSVLEEEAMSIAAGLRTKAEIESEKEQRQRSRGATPVKATKSSLLSPSILEEIKKEAPDSNTRGIITFTTLAKYGLQILMAVLKRYGTGRDHGLYTTIVEETLRALYIDNLGTVTWNLMKQDTRDAFGGDPKLHGGTAFLQYYREHWKPGQRLALVGHSTGAEYIGWFIQHADKLLPAEAKFDVVFLAPACSFRFMHKQLDFFQKRVNHIRVFGLKDEIERNYWEVPVLYRGSLLYMVSGLFEEDEVDMPILGMERYFTDEDTYTSDAVQNVRRYLKDQGLWSVDDKGPGWGSTAERHGAFDQDEKVLDSIKYILSNGF